jgi:hypothetical protein
MSAPTKRTSKGASLPTQIASKRQITQKSAQNSQKSTTDNQIVQLPQQQPPKHQPTNSNLKQQQTDNINSIKNSAVKDVALFPIHVNQLLKFCIVQNLENSPHELFASIQALSQVFSHHLNNNTLYFSNQYIPKHLDKSVVQVEQKKVKQFHSFLTTMTSFFRQNALKYKELHKICLRVTFDLITVLGNINIDTIREDSQNNVLNLFLINFFGTFLHQPSTIEELNVTKLFPHDDIRYYTYSFLQIMIPLAAVDNLDTQHWAFTIPDFNRAIFRANILTLLSGSKFSLVTGKRLLKNSTISTSMEDYSKKQRKLLSDLWFAYLRGIKTGDRTLTLGYVSPDAKNPAKNPIFDDVSIFSRIFSVMDSLLLPNITHPLLLSDFLSAAFNFGGIIAVQALSGVFTLMQKHKLDYPNFFTQFYSICTLDILYSPHSIVFFKLLNLVLSGNYIPMYLVIGFMKRLSRLALYGPSTATIYTTALLFNIYRKHPMTAYLINRKAVIISGIAKNAQRSEEIIAEIKQNENAGKHGDKNGERDVIGPAKPIPSPQVDGDNNNTAQDNDEKSMDEQNGVNLFALLKTNKGPQKMKKQDRFLSTLSLTTIPNTNIKKTNHDKEYANITKQPDDVTKEDLEKKWTNGKDPFVLDVFGVKQIPPQDSNARISSLIEMKDLMSHFLQQVRTSAKLLFDDNAPKHTGDISHLLLFLSYHSVIQQALLYRAKNLIPTAFQKPLGLLGKSERIVDSNEKYDEEFRKIGEDADKERNSIESIFMW